MHKGERIRVNRVTEGIVLQVKEGTVHLLLDGGSTWWEAIEEFPGSPSTITVTNLGPARCPTCERSFDA